MENKESTEIKQPKKPYLRPDYKPKNWWQRNWIELLTIAVGVIIIHIFLLFKAFNGNELNSTNASEFGSFIGGYMGTLFALVIVIFLYTTLRDQRRTSESEKFVTEHQGNINDITVYGQDEPSVTLSFINYPKFPVNKTVFQKGVEFIAKSLLSMLKQNRIGIVFNNETFMLERNEEIDKKIDLNLT